MSESDIQQFIKESLKAQVSSLVVPDINGPFKLLPSLNLWNPCHYSKIDLHCPFDGQVLRDSEKWTDFESASNLRPRTVYGLTRNFILISAIYKCDFCDRKILAHDESLLKEAFSKGVSPNYILFKKCAISADLYDNIVNSAAQGKHYVFNVSDF